MDDLGKSLIETHPKKKTCIWIDARLLERLKILAALKGTSKSTLVEAMIASLPKQRGEDKHYLSGVIGLILEPEPKGINRDQNQRWWRT